MGDFLLQIGLIGQMLGPDVGLGPQQEFLALKSVVLEPEFEHILPIDDLVSAEGIVFTVAGVEIELGVGAEDVVVAVVMGHTGRVNSVTAPDHHDGVLARLAVQDFVPADHGFVQAFQMLGQGLHQPALQRFLAGEEALQGWLVQTLAQHLKSLDKTVIGWDEILDGQPGQDPIVMIWRGDGIDAARMAHDNGNHYILSPYTKLYFDARNSKYDTLGTHQIINWQDVLKFRFQDYTFQRKELLLGAQANVWTEHLANKADLKEKVAHRLYPLAEILWNGEPVEDVMEFWNRWRDLGFRL